jgi:LL-diaminopimelate aminotransferase
MNINKNYLNLKDSYLFSKIAQKVGEYKAQNPGKEIIRLGIGDVTLPLAPVVAQAMSIAALEMGRAETFRGYGEEQGYSFLRQALRGYYKNKNILLDENEFFVSDGAKSDLGNILDIFDADNIVLIPDPVYPAYVDTNIMCGRKIIYADGGVENNFLPHPDKNIKADIIYLCSPNNPTGAVYDRASLKLWVDYALQNGAVILFDGAYEAFIQDKNLPASIYQIEGAEKCAIEFCSLSKTAGFTGTRCGYTVVPRELRAGGVSLNKLYLRRQTTKFNGVSYIVQRGAQAVFSPEGLAQNRENINYYMANAQIIAGALGAAGVWFTGGKNSPYIWFKCPGRLSSWDFFDRLLGETGVVGTPGAGFGARGEGFFRLSAFGRREDIVKATEKLRGFLLKF